MSGDKILGPHIFNENLNGERYLDFLNTHFQEYLAEIPLALLRNLWFQQDGAPPITLPHWIGNGGAVEWTARSPDLTPLDFYLCGALKNIIYKTEIHSIEYLIMKIRQSFQRIRRQICSKGN